MNCLKFEYDYREGRGIDQLNDFVGEKVTEVNKYRSPNAVGWCIVDDKQVMSGEYIFKKEDGSIVVLVEKGSEPIKAINPFIKEPV